MRSVSDRLGPSCSPACLVYIELHKAVRNQTAMFVLYEFAAIFELSPRDLIEWEKGHSVYGAGPVITHVPDPAHEKVQGVLERVFYMR